MSGPWYDRRLAWARQRAAVRRAAAERNLPRWPGDVVTPIHREPGAPTPAELVREALARDRVGRPETPEPTPEPSEDPPTP